MITVLDLYKFSNTFRPLDEPRTLYVLNRGIYQGVENEYHGWIIYSLINREDLEHKEAEFYLVNNSDGVIYPIAEAYAIHWELLDIVYPTREKEKILHRLNTISKLKEEYCGELPL